MSECISPTRNWLLYMQKQARPPSRLECGAKCGVWGLVQAAGVLRALHPVASRLCAWGAACSISKEEGLVCCCM